LGVTIAGALFGVVAPPALAQNSESAPAAAALMKSKPPAGGTVTVKVTNWREADLVELQVVESGLANWKKVLDALRCQIPRDSCGRYDQLPVDWSAPRFTPSFERRQQGSRLGDLRHF
jgi:hypothetical protein